MMTGRVTREREAVIPLKVRALGGRAETVHAVLDTGFTEHLALPRDTITHLKLPYRGSEHVALADGKEAEVAMYRAIVEWHGYARPVTVFAIDAGVLLGMALIAGSRLTLDAVPGGSVQIEPLS